MHSILLVAHSYLRWAVFTALLFVVLRGLRTRGIKTWTRADSRINLVTSIALDIQVTLGFVLYFAVSPLAARARSDFKAAMHDPVLRFWAVEHLIAGVAALVIWRVGRIIARRAPTAGRQRRRCAIAALLALAAVFAAIPWPWLHGVGRPLLRW